MVRVITGLLLMLSGGRRRSHMSEQRLFLVCVAFTGIVVMALAPREMTAQERSVAEFAPVLSLIHI